MKQQLEAAVAAIVLELFDQKVTIDLTRTDEKFGDYATNVALQLAKTVGQNPRAIAETLCAKLLEALPNGVADAAVAGPGFINLTLADAALIAGLVNGNRRFNEGQRVLLEYSCPNAFKELHTGHLYQTVVGDALGKLLEASGATVFRANFGGDVGLHVAKCLFGIQQTIGDDVVALDMIAEADQPGWISAAYVAGASAYENDDTTKQAIDEINKQVYGFHANDGHTTPLAQIYWQCRAWSYDYFKAFYDSIDVAPFDKYYPESTTFEPGLALVRKHLNDVFEDSDGAVVFKGEAVGLHTRVFITSKGLPTYEAKDLGVIAIETTDFSYDRRVIMTGNDQSEYMKVVFAALKAIDSDLAAKQTHLTNGTIRFGSGQKMSSRLGNVTRAVDVITEVGKVATAVDEATQRQVTLGAIKYSFLKHRIGGDIAFDIDESVSLEGNSGPYLQYAYARACSILAKAEYQPTTTTIQTLEPGERTLVRKLGECHEVVVKATNELMPHLICSYLYELAQSFNRFYEHNRVIGDARQSDRLQLVASYAKTLHDGLTVLGIPTPERM